MRLLLLIVVISAMVTAEAGVYTWIDEQGRTNYSDRPPADLSSEKLDLDSLSVSTIGSAGLRESEQKLLDRMDAQARAKAEKRRQDRKTEQLIEQRVGQRIDAEIERQTYRRSYSSSYYPIYGYPIINRYGVSYKGGYAHESGRGNQPRKHKSRHGHSYGHGHEHGHRPKSNPGPKPKRPALVNTKPKRVAGAIPRRALGGGLKPLFPQ